MKSERIKNTFIYLYLLVLFQYNYVIAQPFHTTHTTYNFQNFQLDNGKLDSDFIYDLYQDKKGFIWICTLNGLYRYDGYNYKHYHNNPDVSNNIPGNSPVKILPNTDSGFWVSANSSGITLSGEGIDYYDPNSDSFTNYLLDTILNSPVNIVNDMLWDSQKIFFWIGTANGLVKYFPKNTTHEIIPKSLNHKIYSLQERNIDELWVGTQKGVYRSMGENFEKINIPIEDCKISSIFFLHSDKVLLGTSIGLYSYDIKKKNLIAIKNNRRLPKDVAGKHANNINKIFQDKDGQIWIGSQRGLFLLNKEKDSLQDYSSHILPNTDYLISSVNTIIQDQAGSIWIGKNNGLTKISPLKGKIENYQLSHPKLTAFAQKNNPRKFGINGYKGNTTCAVKAIFSKNKQFDWIGTSLGLYQFNSEKGTFFQDHILFEKIPELKQKNITALLIDSKQNYWIGTNNGTTHSFEATQHLLYHYDSSKDKVIIFSNSAKELQIPNGPIKAIEEDVNNHIWIACAKGITKFISKDKRMIRYHTNPKDTSTISSNSIHIVYLDNDKRIWVGTNDNGLNLYQYETDQFIQFRNKPNNKNSLSNNRINALYQTTDGWLWVGTELGLNKINPKTNKIIRQDFSNKSIRGIAERSPGMIWVSTNKQLHTYNVSKNVLNTYSAEDGVGNTIFINNTCRKKANGDLFFGSTTGLYYARKENSLKAATIPSFRYTALSIQQKEVTDSLLKKDFFQNASIQLNNEQNSLSIQFAVLDFKPKAYKQYRYLLEGYNKDWQNIGSRNKISFANLAPKTYQLHLEEITSDDIFNKKAEVLTITITPPWYATLWAKFIYILSASVLLTLFYLLKLKTALRKKETKQLKELNEFKYKMYSSITHDFRSPLTIIQGAAEHISNKKYKKETDLIDRSSQRLLNLINNFSDLSKIESVEFKTNKVNGNITNQIKHTVTSFQNIAEMQNIDLQYLPKQQKLIMDYDADIMHQIISNLLSNAIKFTQKNGTIILSSHTHKIINKEELILTVNDTGIGIAKNDQLKIFDRFYQVNNTINNQQGSGVGLAYAKKLITLLGGMITVESKLGFGSTFMVQLPITNLAHQDEISLPIVENISKKASPISTLTKGALSVLLVDDNQDMIDFIKICLKGKYKISWSKNGKEGLKKAIKLVPDIIISDIKMPELDGYQLCNKLRKDYRTSHIPIVFLTGKVDHLSKIKGLQKGADAYLTKPFNKEELIVRMEQLIQSRKKLQQYYLKSSNYIKTIPAKITKEEAYLKMIQKLVEDNFENSQFSVHFLAQSLNLSRTTVFRKIKALTGRSAADYIRLIRLQKARYLLKSTDLSIGEIAFKVGYNEHAYFSKCYLEEFGHTPKEERSKVFNS